MKISCIFLLLALLGVNSAIGQKTPPVFIYFRNGGYNNKGTVSGETSHNEFANYLKPFLESHLVLAFFIKDLQFDEYSWNAGEVYHTRSVWDGHHPNRISKRVVAHHCYHSILGDPQYAFENVKNVMSAFELLYEQGFANSYVISKDDSLHNKNHNQVNVYCAKGRIHLIHFTREGKTPRGDKDLDIAHERASTIYRYRNNTMGCPVVIIMFGDPSRERDLSDKYTAKHKLFEKDWDCGWLLKDITFVICYRDLIFKRRLNETRLYIKEMLVEGEFKRLPQLNTELDVTLITTKNENIEFKVSLQEKKLNGVRWTSFNLEPMTYKGDIFEANHHIHTQLPLFPFKTSYYCEFLTLYGPGQKTVRYRNLIWKYFGAEGKNYKGIRGIYKDYALSKAEVRCPGQPPRHCILGCVRCGSLWTCVANSWYKADETGLDTIEAAVGVRRNKIKQKIYDYVSEDIDQGEEEDEYEPIFMSNDEDVYEYNP